MVIWIARDFVFHVTEIGARILVDNRERSDSHRRKANRFGVFSGLDFMATFGTHFGRSSGTSQTAQ